MLHIQSISKQYGSTHLFEEASVNISTRTKMALIGPNGSGKSTLIKMILGLEEPDSGIISKAKSFSIGYLAQEVPRLEPRTVIEEAMRLDGRREILLATKIEIEKELETAAQHDELVTRYGRILEELEHLDEYRLESRAKEILSGMGFSTGDFNRNLSEFSGGWLMRVALARVLLMDPDLLLLDEPTNHLDLESLLWLEEFLIDFKGAILMVSHDTKFLNAVVQEVLEIDQKQLTVYKGNLDAYAVQKEERLRVLESQFQNQQAKIAHLRKFIDRFKSKATKARQAQSRIKQIEKMDLIELPENRDSIDFRFPPAPHSGQDVVSARNVSLSFGDKKIFEGLNWTLQKGSRIAIVGVNGAGKTTLLRLLANELQTTAGEIRYGYHVALGYYAQHQADELAMDKTILEELWDSNPELSMTQVRGVAGAFLFSGDAVDKRCKVLSGGEKARVALGKLLLSPSNCLFLDEPTNHLDTESRGILLNALMDYEGTLILVSHDRDFVSPLADTVLEILPQSQKGAQVVQVIGGYEDYLARKQREAKARMSESKEKEEEFRRNRRAAEKLATQKANELNTDTTLSRPSNNQVRSWERERDKLELEISKLEEKQVELASSLSDPTIYNDKEKMKNTVSTQTTLSKNLEEKMKRWEELCLKLQS